MCDLQRIEVMKTIVWKSLWGVVMLWGIMACSDVSEEAPVNGGEEREGVELAIAMQGDFELNTRTQLVTSEPMHHIEHMYAYLFASSGTGWMDMDKCIYEEKLPWQPTAMQASTFRCRLKTEVYQAIEQQAAGAKELMLLVVGVDNHPETYTFPGKQLSSNTDPHLGMKGLKLADVQLALAQGVELGRMSFTEVFAGFKRFSAGETMIQVNLSRRVAGVLCYLNDIPAKINDYHIVGVQLHCLGGVNRAGGLKPKLDDDPTLPNYQPTFIELANQKDTHSTLLAEVNLKEWGAEADEEGGLLYIPPVQEADGLHTLPNSVLMGAFMLPVQQDAQFNIRLVGEKRNADNQPTDAPLYVFTEKDTDGYYLVKNSQGQTTYPVKADYIYQIGVKPYQNDTDYDDPLSLKGKPIVVKPARWKDKNVNVDFPNTPLGIIVDTGKSSAFRYDCMSGTDQIEVSVLSEQYRDKEWTLTSSADWLWFEDGKGQEVATLTGTGKKQITIHIRDYIHAASENRNEPDKDYRWTDLTLQVKGTPIQSTTRIRQWNALIVTTCDEDHTKFWDIAFSRLDNGAVFKPDGTVDVTNVELYQWGYDGKSPHFFIQGGASGNTGDDGMANFNHNEKWKDYWPDCVLNKARRGDWYVPARIELHALLRDKHDKPSANLAEDILRWSSTVAALTLHKSYASSLKIKDAPEWWDEKGDYEYNRTNTYRVRLAHKIEKQSTE